MSSLPSVWFHNFTDLSAPPVASDFPSGLKAIVSTMSVWPLNSVFILPSVMSHTRAVLSWLAVATSLASVGWNATAYTGPVCPASTFFSFREPSAVMSQSLTTLSNPAVASVLPSGDTATA